MEIPAVKYTLVFALCSAGLALSARNFGGVGWLLLWPASSFLLISMAYAGVGPSLLGKRPDGTIAPASLVLLLPFLLLTWLSWHGLRLFSRRPPYHQIAPGVWLGRRLLASELPDGISVVVDLTAEFFEPAGIRRRCDYHCLPTLDARAPDEAAFRELMKQLADLDRNLYVHCASGCGRAPTLGVALLIARGRVASVEEGERIVRAIRPGVHLEPVQRRFLNAWLLAQ